MRELIISVYLFDLRETIEIKFNQQSVSSQKIKTFQSLNSFHGERKRLKMAFVIEFVLTCAVLYLISKYFHNYWTRHGFKQQKPWFIVGDIGKLMTQSLSVPEFISKTYYQNRNERFMGMYNLYRPALFVLDTKLINDIMIRDFNNFHDHTIDLDVKNDPLIGNLFSLTGQKWRDLRIKLSPTFTSGKLKMMFPIIKSCADVLIKYIDKNAKKNQNVFSSKDLFTRYNTNVNSSVAYGIDNDCINERDHPFYKQGMKFFEPTIRNSIRMFFFMFLPNFMELFKVKFAPSDVDTFFRKLVKEMVEYREKNDFKRNDFMDLLLQLKNKGYVSADKNETLDEDDNDEVETNTQIDNETTTLTKLTLDEVSAQAFVFFLASFETSSSAMNFLLIELLRNKKIQRKVQDEIDETFATQGVTYESVKNLKYLEACLLETLRKYPPVPILTRQCTSDFKIPDSDLVLPKGIDVSIPVFALHRDPEIYDDPLEFKPERFLDDPTGNGRAEGLFYIPFGSGPRHCIVS